MNTPHSSAGTVTGASAAAPFSLSLQSRWWQLLCGVVCAMVASNPQYIWTLLTRPLMAQLGVSLPSLQITFSILIVCQTFLSPLEGYLIERFGPRWLLAAGGAITGLSWILTGRAESLLSIYLCYGVLGGHRRRHCCRWYDWIDGALVSGPPWLRHWRGDGRLRHGRHAYHVPCYRRHRPVRLPAHA